MFQISVRSIIMRLIWLSEKRCKSKIRIGKLVLVEKMKNYVAECADMKHVTCDLWCMTYDVWNMTSDMGVFYSSISRCAGIMGRFLLTFIIMLSSRLSRL